MKLDRGFIYSCNFILDAFPVSFFPNKKIAKKDFLLLLRLTKNNKYVILKVTEVYDIDLYYLQSRFYDPVVGRFLNADDFIMLLLYNNVINPFVYCNNEPILGYDPYGYANAGDLVSQIKISAIFSNFAYDLLISFSATLAKISAYITGVLLPKAVSFFWWHPWLIVGTVAVAVAIVVAAVIVYNNANDNKTVEEILKTKKGSIKQAPLPPEGPHWDDILKKTLKEIKELARKGAKGYKEIYKLLNDSRFNR